MTATAIPAASRTRLRLTVRGRRLLAWATALPLVAALSFTALGGAAALASGDAAAPEGTFSEVTVLSGETLWSIAQDVAPNSDPRDVVDEIVRLNALEGVTVSAGQRIALPPQYSTAD